MAPKFPLSSLELGYSLYAVDFGPRDANCLVVGGGRGSGNFGGENKMTVLHLSQNKLQVAGELEFSRDEDSVMSLAVVPATMTGRKKRDENNQEASFLVLAGVNMSTAAEDENNHLRSLLVTLSQPQSSRSKRRGGNSVQDGSEGCKVSIRQCTRSRTFRSTHPSIYQRLLRAKGHFAVVASANGSHHEHSVLTVGSQRLRKCISLETSEDIEDLDLLALDADRAELVYCYPDRLEMATFSFKSDIAPKPSPSVIYKCKDGAFTFRAVRYLTSGFLLCVGNLPRNSGIILQVYRLPSRDAKDNGAKLVMTSRVGGKVSATALAVACLTDHGTQEGDAQFIIAVGSNDSSVHVHTLEHRDHGRHSSVSHLRRLCTLSPSHKFPITGLSFSALVYPSNHALQSIRLASVSLYGTVKVYAIPLKKMAAWNATSDKAQARTSRYSVATGSGLASPLLLLAILSLVFLLISIIW